MLHFTHWWPLTLSGQYRHEAVEEEVVRSVWHVPLLLPWWGQHKHTCWHFKKGLRLVSCVYLSHKYPDVEDIHCLHTRALFLSSIFAWCRNKYAAKSKGFTHLLSLTRHHNSFQSLWWKLSFQYWLQAWVHLYLALSFQRISLCGKNVVMGSNFNSYSQSETLLNQIAAINMFQTFLFRCCRWKRGQHPRKHPVAQFSHIDVVGGWPHQQEICL